MSMDAVSPLRRRMIEDMNARKLCAGTQRGHLRSCKRFAAFLKRSPETATFEDIRRFQLHLAETGVSICTRNCIMTGLRFWVRGRCADWILPPRSITSVSLRRSRW
jgi:integrase/recombinase XerD